MGGGSGGFSLVAFFDELEVGLHLCHLIFIIYLRRTVVCYGLLCGKVCEPVPCGFHGSGKHAEPQSILDQDNVNGRSYPKDLRSVVCIVNPRDAGKLSCKHECGSAVFVIRLSRSVLASLPEAQSIMQRRLFIQNHSG